MRKKIAIVFSCYGTSRVVLGLLVSKFSLVGCVSINHYENVKDCISRNNDNYYDLVICDWAGDAPNWVNSLDEMNTIVLADRVLDVRDYQNLTVIPKRFTAERFLSVVDFRLKGGKTISFVNH